MIVAFIASVLLALQSSRNCVIDVGYLLYLQGFISTDSRHWAKVWWVCMWLLELGYLQRVCKHADRAATVFSDKSAVLTCLFVNNMPRKLKEHFFKWINIYFVYNLRWNQSVALAYVWKCVFPKKPAFTAAGSDTSEEGQMCHHVQRFVWRWGWGLVGGQLFTSLALCQCDSRCLCVSSAGGYFEGLPVLLEEVFAGPLKRSPTPRFHSSFVPSSSPSATFSQARMA